MESESLDSEISVNSMDSEPLESDIDIEQPAREEEEIDEAWMNTKIESLVAVREAEIESKRFELHNEREDIDATLTIKDVQIQKQVRGITTECGKLRLEVGWMERDLSEVKENARRQMLEIRTILQAKKLKLENNYHEGQKKLMNYKNELDKQRDKQAMEMIDAKSNVEGKTKTLDQEIAGLNAEIDEIRKKLDFDGDKFEEKTEEAKKTEFMLQKEIRLIQQRVPEIEHSMQAQQEELEKLQKKLNDYEAYSDKVRQKILIATEKRAKLREKLNQTDKENWTNRVQALINLE